MALICIRVCPENSLRAQLQVGRPALAAGNKEQDLVLRVLGVSVTHPASHAKPARGKAPLIPALGLPCPTVRGSVLAPVLCALQHHLAGAGRDSPMPLVFHMALPKHCWPCVEGSAARCSRQLFADPFFPCLCPSHALEVLEEDASPAVCRQPLRRGPHGEV